MYDRIKALCEKRGMSIYELERSAGIGNGTIGKWRDNRKPNISSLEAVAKVLDISVADLMSDDK